MNEWYVYIIELSDGTYYTGITNDLDRRMEKHSSGKGSKYVRSRLPLRLVYWEVHQDRSSASKREVEIKKLKRAQKEELALGEYKNEGRYVQS